MKAKIFFILTLFICFIFVSIYSAEGKKIKLTALNSMQRIGQKQKPFGGCKVEIQAAKNEVESFQIVVTALNKNIVVVSAEISNLVNNNGSVIEKENIKLFREEYVRVRKSTPRALLPPGNYPDPLVPFINPVTGKPIEPRRRLSARWGERAETVGHEMYALPFDIWKGQNQPLWVDVHVPKYISVGVYKGECKVIAEDGIYSISEEIPITLTVWDFTLPDGPTHRNHFGGFRNIPRYFDGVEINSERFKEIEMRYCEEIANHRINPPIPHSLLPEVNDDGSLEIIPERHIKLKNYLNRLHVTDFDIPRSRFGRLPRSTKESNYKYISPDEKKKAQRYYREFYKYLKDNGWEKRAYLYMLDEPNLSENYEQVLALGNMVHEAVPELKCLVVEQTYPHYPDWPDIDPAVDIWCPKFYRIDRETINEKIAQGDEVWSYTALSLRASSYQKEYEYTKSFDQVYWHIDQPLAVYRAPTWINWQYDINGLLYWSTMTGGINDPWWNPALSHSGRHFNGGGFLFYPGEPCGIDGPVSSIRMKNLRDCMEDYEYFAILKDLKDKETVDEIVTNIAPNWWGWSKKSDDYFEAREKLANKIIDMIK